MPSESRHPYLALTPNQADFALQPLTEASTSSPITTFLPDAPVVLDGRWQSVVHSVHEFISSNAGLLLVTAAQAVFSFVNVAVKILQNLDEPVSTLQLIIVRMGITYICSVAYMLIRRVPHPFIGPEGVRMLLGLRGITGFIGLNGTYFSLQYLSLSDVTVISFLVPMCTAMSGSFFLKESFTRREAVAGVCSLFGVVLIARPEFLFGSPDGSSTIQDKHRTLAIAVALSGVVGSTGAMTSIRAIGQRAHPMHLLAFFSIQSVIAASVIMAILREPIVFPTRPLWLALLAVIGILGFAAQILLTMGFQREKAGRASIALYTQIIFASILERIFFQTLPTFLSLLGTSIILSSAIYVAVNSYVSITSNVVH
ncbi:drug/metabolite transporter superfamily [Mycena haematopus]|nr:drug/metabolite transporter superfamily [Mycena haematopus]